MTLLLVFAIFAVNVYLERPVLESFLFSMALAVGLTPQLLPAIISVNLSHGARRMARQHVVVKRLASIENFGSMNVLCSDKTGTLTEGSMRLHAALDLDGQPSERVLFHGHINAMFETGFPNPWMKPCVVTAPSISPAIVKWKRSPTILFASGCPSWWPLRTPIF